MVFLAGTAILHKNKLLLVRSAAGDQKGKWGPPAGHLEPGETPEETAIRETKEETGLDVELKGIIQIVGFNYKDKDYLAVFYLAKAKKPNKIKPQEAEVSEYVWASQDEIESDKFEFRKKFLKEPILMAFKRKPVENSIYKTIEIEP